MPTAQRVLLLKQLTERAKVLDAQPYRTSVLSRALLAVLAFISATINAPVWCLVTYSYFLWPSLRIAFPNLMIFWLFVNVMVAYRLEEQGATTLALFLAVALIATALHGVTKHFSVRKGALRIFEQTAERLYPGRVLSYALILTASYGILYLHISHTHPNSFSASLDWHSALYFSVVTLATVGYGDIHPDSNAARFTVMTEIALGLVLLVIALNATLNTWMQLNKQKEPTEAEKRRTAARTELVDEFFHKAEVAQKKGINFDDVKDEGSN